MEVLPYAILMETRKIRVKHFDLEESWWDRGSSSWERGASQIEWFLQSVTGLKKIKTRHSHQHNYVEFSLREGLFIPAACALKFKFEPDPMWERKLLDYPD